MRGSTDNVILTSMSSTLPDSQATGLPGIISVDDHVVEPPHVWQDRLPARMRDQGPRIEQAKWGEFSLAAGASYKQEIVEDGRPGDYWVYEDRLVYVHKRHVAILLDATPGGDAGLRPLEDVHRRPHVRRDAARLLRAEGPRRRPRTGRRRRAHRLPTFPRFCGQTFMEGKGTRSSVWRASGPTTTG